MYTATRICVLLSIYETLVYDGKYQKSKVKKFGVRDFVEFVFLAIYYISISVIIIKTLMESVQKRDVTYRHRISM